MIAAQNRSTFTRLAGLLLGAALFTADAAGQIVEATPGNRSGAPTVRLTGFPANADVDVTFVRSLPDWAQSRFSATARYRADENGVVIVADPPISGDWAAPMPEAPFWSMRPDPQFNIGTISVPLAGCQRPVRRPPTWLPAGSHDSCPKGILVPAGV